MSSSTAPFHRTLPFHNNSVVTCLVLSRDRAIAASDDHSISVYDLLAGKLRHTFKHDGGVWALAVTSSRGSDTLVSGSTDRTVRIWDLASGRCTHVFGGHTNTVRSLAIVKPEWIEMEDGRREKWPKRALIVTGSRDNTLRVWTLPRSGDAEYFNPDDSTNNPYHRFVLEGHEGAIRGLAARGRTAVSGSYDCTVRVWDLVTGACRWVLVGHTQKVYSVVLNLPRQQACSGSMDSTVRVWDLKTGTCAHTLAGHTSLVGLLALSPHTLVSGAADATMRVWDPNTGALRHTLAAHTGAITCFQHDERKLLSGSDGTLKLWDMRDGSFVRDLLAGITGVWQVAFEGRWCVAATNRTHGTAAVTEIQAWNFSEEVWNSSEQEGWGSAPLEVEVSDEEKEVTL
ncbi:cell division control protein 4 [Mycena capillaripes]|nr:cell division control protein 4 [Mycena capillaripes]